MAEFQKYNEFGSDDDLASSSDSSTFENDLENKDYIPTAENKEDEPDGLPITVPKSESESSSESEPESSSSDSSEQPEDITNVEITAVVAANPEESEAENKTPFPNDFFPDNVRTCHTICPQMQKIMVRPYFFDVLDKILQCRIVMYNNI